MLSILRGVENRETLVYHHYNLFYAFYLSVCQVWVSMCLVCHVCVFIVYVFLVCHLCFSVSYVFVFLERDIYFSVCHVFVLCVW